LGVAAAAGKLGSLVKGKLLGIEITRHGLSPRILDAVVVGTRGRTRVTGARLRQIFGLRTTFAAFTTITTTASAGELTGAIHPAPSNRTVSVQSATGGGWHTIANVALGGAGSYTVVLAPLPQPRR
jgi:hypothetical protein